MSKRIEWKETFREGMFTSPELLEKKIHRDLLSYIVHRANRKNRLCWASQTELARVQSCSVRNTKALLDYLVDIGAIFRVPFNELPKRDQMMIRALTPEKVTRNSKAYYVCEMWAKEALAAGSSPTAQESGSIGISPVDRKRGSEKANDRRRRYLPAYLQGGPVIDPNPDHDDWQFINAIDVETGSPTTPLNRVETGSPTTDRTNDNNPAENSATNLPRAVASFDPNPSKANAHSGLISSLPDQHGASVPHGYGGGAAVTPGSKAAGFGLPEGARLEGTELGVAGARANERRAL